jgi:hypothetical protein
MTEPQRCPVCDRPAGKPGYDDTCNIWEGVLRGYVHASSHDLSTCFRRGLALQKRVEALQARNTELVREVANLRGVISRKHGEQRAKTEPFRDGARIEVG